MNHMNHMYDIAITYGDCESLLLGGFAYITFKMKRYFLYPLQRKIS